METVKTRWILLLSLLVLAANSHGLIAGRKVSSPTQKKQIETENSKTTKMTNPIQNKIESRFEKVKFVPTTRKSRRVETTTVNMKEKQSGKLTSESANSTSVQRKRKRRTTTPLISRRRKTTTPNYYDEFYQEVDLPKKRRKKRPPMMIYVVRPTPPANGNNYFNSSFYINPSPSYYDIFSTYYPNYNWSNFYTQNYSQEYGNYSNFYGSTPSYNRSYYYGGENYSQIYNYNFSTLQDYFPNHNWSYFSGNYAQNNWTDQPRLMTHVFMPSNFSNNNFVANNWTWSQMPTNWSTYNPNGWNSSIGSYKPSTWTYVASNWTWTKMPMNATTYKAPN
ncbi:uncharacterized protein LOC132193898 [Neocloeon triangulifer]|uniref:uncharacterized protein LOC132193898 n=1 Tax=Neocloeon triangulifer TaxID=2078957 RepID=UPI00286F1E51|nr:uncharacterized protein LOC132193898 [Neocloeon triangulifer]